MGGSSRHGSVRLAGASLAAALLLAGCGSEVAGSSGPPLLHIGTGTAERAAGAGAPAADARGTAPGGALQDPYPLDGALPSGPPSAMVWRYAATATSRSDVVALATALGVSAAPVRHAHGWVVAAGSGTLRVRDGAGLWSFARASSPCAPYAVDVDDPDGVMSGVACAVSGTAVPVPMRVSGPSTPTSSVPGPPVPMPSPQGGPAAPPSDAPSDRAALAASRRLVEALGLTVGDARVVEGETGPGMRTVVADPVVGGVPTSGLRTLVEVDRAGVVAATGVLGTPARGDSYPIVSAAAALDLLRAMPQPEIAMACAIGRVCPGLGPRVVTGARLGLAMAYDAGAPVLVPAWLFSIKGSDDAVAVVAVQRRYVADPGPSPDRTAGSSAGSGPGTETVPPVPHGTSPVTGDPSAVATGAAAPAGDATGVGGSPVPPPGPASTAPQPGGAVTPAGSTPAAR